MRSIYLVARRDYLGYVTSIGFWIGMLLTPLLMGLGAMAPSLIQSATSAKYYAVIEQGDTFTQELEKQLRGSFLDTSNARTFRVEIPISSSDDISEFMLSGERVDGKEGPLEVSSIIYVSADGRTVEHWEKTAGAGISNGKIRDTIEVLAQRQVFSEQGVDLDILKQAERAEAKLQQKVPRAAEEGVSTDRTMQDDIPRVVSIIIAFFLWIMIFSVVNYLLMGTIEERSNKIFDTLLTSVKLPQLLAGKLLAVLGVSVTLTSFWLVGGTLFTTYVSSSLSPELVGGILSAVSEAIQPSIAIPALISFVLGYLMYGALFLAVGSLCDTVQEAQTLMTPLIILLMAPLAIGAISIENPDSSLVQMMTWVPFFTPFLLILRMPIDPPMWEVVAQMGLMVLSTIIILWIATRVYRAGAVNGAGMSDVGTWFRNLIPGMKAKSAGPID